MRNYGYIIVRVSCHSDNVIKPIQANYYFIVFVKFHGKIGENAVNKKLTILAAPVIALTVSTATANDWWHVRPYVGADVEWRHMGLPNDLGGNLFKHDYPQGNIYAGVQLNEYIGVEVGFEATERKTRVANIPANTIFNNTTEDLYNLDFNSTASIKGPHANLVGFLPLHQTIELELIGMVGIANLKGNFTRTFVKEDGLVTLPLLDKFTKRKNVLTLGAGLQHMFLENWGVRGMIKWENTNRFKIALEEDTKQITKLKNSIIYSIGAFFKF